MSERVTVYSVIRNEERMLPYFLRHYGRFAQHIVLYDDASTDRTRDIAAADARVELRDWPFTTGKHDEKFIEFAEATYKEARGIAEWVMWPDGDELLYHPDMQGLLAGYRAAGVEVPLTRGVELVADAFPTIAGQIYDEVKCGLLADSLFAKPVVFQPHVDIHWRTGKHSLVPPMDFKRSETAEIVLLHCRYLEPAYVLERCAAGWARAPQYWKDSGYITSNNPDSDLPLSYKWYMREVHGKTYPKVMP